MLDVTTLPCHAAPAMLPRDMMLRYAAMIRRCYMRGRRRCRSSAPRRDCCRHAAADSHYAADDVSMLLLII